MWNHFCSSFFVGGRKSGDKGKQYDRAGFEGNEKTVQPRCARKHLTTAMESRGTTSHSSPSAPPSPFGARLTPLNLALLDKKPYNLASLVGTFLDFKDR
jgi:hypothetical protein